MFKKIVLILSCLICLSLNSFAVNTSQIIVSTKTAEMQIRQAEDSFNTGNIAAAHQIIQTLRPLLSEITELHSQLFLALKEDPNAKITAEKEKEFTIEYGKVRDRANFLAGQISIKEGNYLEASKHLSLVVQSQRSTELGVRAYNLLREIGFSPKLTVQDQI